MEQRISGRKQKNVFWIGAAGVLGAGLLAAWLATGKKGPGEEDRQIYEQAAAMQEQVDKLGFTDFRLEDYPVAMYDGKKDYVFYQGEILPYRDGKMPYLGPACSRLERGF